MMVAVWILAAIGMVALIIAIRLIWIWRHIRTHSQIEPLHIACPDLNQELLQLTQDIAQLAGIGEAPLIFIKRSHLPNAFVIAAIIRPEIYLSDELLEEASDRSDGVEYLIKILCHEVAHIKRNDSVRIGLWTLAMQLTSSFEHISSFCVRNLVQVEQETHTMAHKIEMRLESLQQDRRNTLGGTTNV